MSKHVTVSPSEAADRLAIRELVEAYAHCADRRDAKSPDRFATRFGFRRLTGLRVRPWDSQRFPFPGRGSSTRSSNRLSFSARWA